MEFRIVKTKARPEYSYPYKYHGVDWFIVQYKDEPSLWNLCHPSWKNLKYNQQEFLEYNSITKPKLVSIGDCGTWASGSLIPTYELAWQLLDMFKYRHGLIGEGHEEIVYQSKMSKETAQANKLASEYDYLVSSTEDKLNELLDANKAAQKPAKHKTTRRKKKSDD